MSNFFFASEAIANAMEADLAKYNAAEAERRQRAAEMDAFSANLDAKAANEDADNAVMVAQFIASKANQAINQANVLQAENTKLKHLLIELAKRQSEAQIDPYTKLDQACMTYQTSGNFALGECFRMEWRNRGIVMAAILELSEKYKIPLTEIDDTIKKKYLEIIEKDPCPKIKASEVGKPFFTDDPATKKALELVEKMYAAEKAMDAAKVEYEKYCPPAPATPK